MGYLRFRWVWSEVANLSESKSARLNPPSSFKTAYLPDFTEFMKPNWFSLATFTASLRPHPAALPSLHATKTQLFTLYAKLLLFIRFILKRIDLRFRVALQDFALLCEIRPWEGEVN